MGLDIEQWPDLLEGLSTWFSRCKDLECATVTFQDGCWSTAVQELRDRSPAHELDDSELEAIIDDLHKYEPSLLRRYFWDENEDEGSVRDRPEWSECLWLAPEAIQDRLRQDIFDHYKMLCQAQLRVLRDMLSRRRIPYILETPDFKDYWQLVYGDM